MVSQLASRPTSAAEGITNAAASGLTDDLRSAAGILHEMERPMPLLSKLNSELAKIVNACPDAATARKLRRLIGEA